MTIPYINISSTDWVVFGVDATPSEIVSTKEMRSLEKVAYVAVWHNDSSKLDFLGQYKNVNSSSKLNILKQLEDLIFKDDIFQIRIYSASQSKERIYDYSAILLEEVWNLNADFISTPKKKVEKYGLNDLRVASFLINGTKFNAHTAFSLMGYLIGFSTFSGRAIKFIGHLMKKFGDKQPKKVAFLLDNLPGDKANDVTKMYDSFLFFKDNTKFGKLIESHLKINKIESFAAAPFITENSANGPIQSKNTALMRLTDWIARIVYVYVNYKNRKHSDVNIEDSELNRRLFEVGERLIKNNLLDIIDIKLEK